MTGEFEPNDDEVERFIVDPDHLVTDTDGTAETLPVEIERKFLVGNTLDIDLEFMGTGEYIMQGYLAIDDQGAVRVRRKGEKYFITYKKAATEHEAERLELETELTEEQFNALWPGTEGRRIEKVRNRVEYGEYVIELDLFFGANAGKQLAEVEFITRTEADAFQPPDWFRKDVTADKRYGNASIAEHGFPEE